MIMDIDKNLSLLNLNHKEAVLYRSALPLGIFTVAEISNASGLKRPTCYIVLDELLKRGLVSIVPKAKKQSYRVEPPETLEKHLDHQKILIQKLMPDLNSLYKSGKNAPITRFYTGQKGIRNIFEDTLKSNVRECYHIGSTQEVVEMLGDEFMRDYIKRRVKKGLRVKTIRMKGREMSDPIYAGGKAVLRNIRYAPKDIYIPDSILIYGNKSSFILLLLAAFDPSCAGDLTIGIFLPLVSAI